MHDALRHHQHPKRLSLRLFESAPPMLIKRETEHLIEIFDADQTTLLPLFCLLRDELRQLWLVF